MINRDFQIPIERGCVKAILTSVHWNLASSLSSSLGPGPEISSDEKGTFSIPKFQTYAFFSPPSAVEGIKLVLSMSVWCPSVHTLMGELFDTEAWWCNFGDHSEVISEVMSEVISEIAPPSFHSLI